MSNRERKNKRSGEAKSTSKIGHFPKGLEIKKGILELPEPDENKGMGDILKGVFSDPDQDPVEQVNEIRRDI
jgi:hypothetical protein